jgi:hypothetical protein
VELSKMPRDEAARGILHEAIEAARPDPPAD